MDWATIDWMSVINLIFCLIILVLGIRRNAKTGVRAFLLIGLGFTMFGISHVCKIFGISGPIINESLIVIRSIGYILTIIGILV